MVRVGSDAYDTALTKKGARPMDFTGRPLKGLVYVTHVISVLSIFRHEKSSMSSRSAVLSGHVIPDGTARSVAERASGTRVHQVLANYQLCDYCPCAEVEGGGGYLRLLTLDPVARRFEVSTYSPYLDDWLDDDENHFVLDLE